VPSLAARDVDQAFQRKMQAEVDEGDHRFYVWRIDGRAVLRTELSTPLRDLSAGLVSAIARQLLLRNASELRELVQCTKSREWWWQHVHDQADAARRRLL